MLETKWDEEAFVTPRRAFSSVELFAGAGGLALGMQMAGFRHVLLNEVDSMACKTLKYNRPDWNVIRGAIDELGYTLVEPKVLKAIMYKVPQKRERLIFVAIRDDLAPYVEFHWPDPYKRVMTLRDAFFRGDLYSDKVPDSDGQSYPEKKARVMAMVPEGGDWRSLPIEEQKRYMGGSFYLGGGKTGMARRLSMDEPSLTLTCAPAQKQTERCHPVETRPLTVREYARIQTFPDSWIFHGNITAKYKQIGNAVPVNLAYAVGRSLIRLFNDIDRFHQEDSQFDKANETVRGMNTKQLEITGL